MKRKRKLRPLTYVYARGFEIVTLQKTTARKRARATAAEPGAAGAPVAGWKERAKHHAGLA
jgi:hypothetical protein